MSPRARAAAGGVGLGLSAGWNLANVGAIADETAHDYGVSLTLVGIFTTALFVMHMAMQLPAGRITDRVGARRIGLAGLGIVVATNTLALAAPDPALTIAMRVFCGVGTAICFVAGSDYVRASGGGAFGQGVFGASGVGSGGLALAIVPQVYRWTEWRAAYLTAAVVAAAGVAVLALGPSDRHHDRPQRLDHLGSLWADVELLRLGALHAASFGLSVLLGDWVVTLLERAGGLTSGVAGIVGSLVLLLGIGSRPLGGWLLRRHPEWTSALLVGSYVTGALGTAALVVAKPLALTVAASFAIGVASGLPFAYVFSTAPKVRPDAPAAAVGIVNMVAISVVLVGVPLLGLGFSAPGDGRVGFAVVALLFLLAVAAVRRPARRPSPAAPRPSR